ncbi:MAG: hypothetical protein CMQ02_08330 [Gammaproteobacteria bacterium]|jgi:hypothetical protein|nr:hypothetical protein [Gammaproteobacteria bacterium]
MMRTANFSACRKYRYSLKRVWNRQSPFVLFIGLNPSTADEINDDPTLTRCMDYAKRWGYGGVCVANLFAYRATKPTDMLRVNDPIGIDNNSWLKKLSKAAGLTVVAWGNHGKHLNRSHDVQNFLQDLHCLKYNLSGEPSHPLYLKSTLKPRIFYWNDNQ